MKRKNCSKKPWLLIRDGLFLAPSRTYGERYIEPLIRKKYRLSKADNSSYDAKDSLGNHYEIKASKVLKLPEKKNNLYNQIIEEIDNIETRKMVKFLNAKKSSYLANIQNVKRDHFDYLIYVLLFEDCIKVFKVEKTKLNKESFKRWCDKHGRYDALGKSGQFGINKNSIDWHIKNFCIDTITWKEAARIFKGIRK